MAVAAAAAAAAARRSACRRRGGCERCDDDRRAAFGSSEFVVVAVLKANLASNIHVFASAYTRLLMRSSERRVAAATARLENALIVAGAADMLVKGDEQAARSARAAARGLRLWQRSSGGDGHLRARQSERRRHAAHSDEF